MRRLIALSAISAFAFLPAAIAASDPQEPPPTVGGRNNGNRSEVTGEASQEVPLPDSSSGEPSSQERPVVTASDPSMWEEQSHRECSPEKDAYGLDKYRCNLATRGSAKSV